MVIIFVDTCQTIITKTRLIKCLTDREFSKYFQLRLEVGLGLDFV